MRFSIRTLLVLSTVLAVLCAALFSLPPFFAAAISFVLLGALPAGLASGIYYGSNNLRAFCGGALAPILPHSLFNGLFIAPWFIVAEETNWWSLRSGEITALKAWEILYLHWNRIGHGQLATQVPVWIAALFCGLLAVAVRRRAVALQEVRVNRDAEVSRDPIGER